MLPRRRRRGSPAARRGPRGVVLELAGLRQRFGRELYGPQGFSARVLRGERIGLIGPNGSGKSTLLRILLGEVAADDGAYGWAERARVGWLPQSLEALDPNLTLVEQLTALPGGGVRAARQALADFLLVEEAVFARTGDCSGGERTRLALCRLLLQPWDALLLDEPTNHLDMESRRAVEQALAAYGGTVPVASHDRFFLDRVCGRLWVFGETGESDGDARGEAEAAGGVLDFDGNYSAWVEAARARAGGTEPLQGAAEAAGDAAALAAAIRSAERRSEALRARLSQASTFSGGRGRRLAAEWKAVQAELADLQRRWREAVAGAPGKGPRRGPWPSGPRGGSP
jgi:ATP-binding cassette subfamily F protein uup